jgi:hypothetical protein
MWPHAIAQKIIGAMTDDESAHMALATVAKMPSGGDPLREIQLF